MKKLSLLLSFRRRDIYNIIEGQERPTSDTDTLTREQADFDQASKDLYAVLFLVLEKTAALLVNKHATGSAELRATGRESRRFRGRPTKPLLAKKCRCWTSPAARTTTLSTPPDSICRS